MLIVRPISQQDSTLIQDFAFESLLGMTNLPRDRDRLNAKIEHSSKCFSKEITMPGLEEYFFVIEDLSTNRIGGTSGILAQHTTSRAFFYRLEKIPTQAKHISAPKELSIITAFSTTSNASEVCSLFLHPSFRHSGLGRLLSLSRFLFVAAFRSRFEDKIHAELRGYIDQRQVSPFWEAVGRYFCNLSFVELMTQIDQDRTFISEILPKFPIYVSLLPKDAQEVLGKTHESTKPALKMLEEEGFTFSNIIDIFDAGPLYIAKTNEIRSIRNSLLVQVDFTDDLLNDAEEYIIGNERMDFRACYGRIKFDEENHGYINKQIAKGLKIKSGDVIRYISPH